MYLARPSPLRLFSKTSIMSIRSGSSKASIVSVNKKDVSVTIDSNETRIDFLHLRDNNAKQFDRNTYQRMSNILDLDVNSKVKSAELTNQGINLAWDDGEFTKFELSEEGSNVLPQPWRGESMESKVSDSLTVDFNRVVHTKDGLTDVYELLLKYGIAFVGGCPASAESTEFLCSMVGVIHPTLFGGFWKFTSDHAYGDTAYSNIPLRAHNDSCYFETSTGLQVFHCLGHDGPGGETLLVDGRHCSEQLRRTDEEAYRVLSSTDVNYRYLEKGKYHFKCAAPVIRTDNFGKFVQMKYNDYDRDLHQNFSVEESEKFYLSLIKLAKIIQSRENELWVKLTPGTVVFIDNWRVLHGRSGFTGRRSMCGCYLTRDDWRNRARILGLDSLN